jgi:hypothetical protein
MTPRINQRSVRGLAMLLDSMPVASCADRICEYKALVKNLGQRDEIISLLRAILSSPAALTEIAGRSYPHVNKFDKVVLVGNNEPQSYRLTLHLWQPPYSERALRQELIHDHRFDFWSTILTGTLESEEFELREARTDQDDGLTAYRQYKFVPEVARTTDFREFYEFQGSVYLSRTGMRREHAGGTYYLDAPRIHRIILPRRGITCSLVLRGPRLRSYSYIYNTTYPSRDTFLQNKMFSERDLSHRLAQILAALEARVL